MSSMTTKYKHPKTHPVFRRVKTSRLSAYKVTALVAVLVGGLLSAPSSLWASPKSNTAVSSSRESLRADREPLSSGSNGKLAKTASTNKVSTVAEATAPEPTKIDRCDNDQDYFVVDDNEFDYFADTNWNDWYRPGELYSTTGKLVVTVYAWDYANSMWHDISMTFTDETCTPEANNIYSAEVGDYNSGYNRTPVTIFIENKADATGRDMPDVLVRPVRSDGTHTSDREVTVTGIADGEKRSVVMDADHGGWLRGEWKINFIINGVRVAQVPVVVPGCSSPCEPPAVQKPTAALVSVFARGSSSVIAKVRLDNRKVSKANLFKVQRIYDGRIQKVVKNRVAKYSAETESFYRIKKGTRIKVFYRTASGWEIILNSLVKRPGTS